MKAKTRKSRSTKSKIFWYLFGIPSLLGAAWVRAQISLTKSELTMSPNSYIFVGETYEFNLQAKDASGANISIGGEYLTLYAQQRCTFDPVTYVCTVEPGQEPVPDLPSQTQMTDHGDGTYSASMSFNYDTLVTFRVSGNGITGSYYANKDWQDTPDTPVIVQVDNLIKLVQATQVGPLPPETNASVIWETKLYIPEAGLRTFQFGVADYAEVTIGPSFYFVGGCCGFQRGQSYFEAGLYDFRMKFSKNVDVYSNRAIITVTWNYNSSGPRDYVEVPQDYFVLQPGIVGDTPIDGAVYPREFCEQKVVGIKTSGLTDKTGTQFTFEANLRDITETVVGTLARGVVLKAELLNWDDYRSPISVDYDWDLHHKTTNFGYDRIEGPDWVSTKFKIEWAGFYSILVEAEGIQCTYDDLFIDFKPSETLDETKVTYAEFPVKITNGLPAAFRIQARDSNNNNISTTLRQLGVGMTMWLESEKTVVKGTVLDYLHDDLDTFDPSSPTLGIDGTPYPGIYLAKITTPEGTPPGEYAIFVQLGEDILLPTPRATVKVESLCLLSDEFYKSVEIMISNNAGRYPTSASYAHEIRLAIQALGEHEGALEACGALIPTLNSPYEFLALDEDSQTISVLGTDKVDDKILEKYETGIYNNSEITVTAEKYKTLHFSIRVEIFWDKLASAEPIKKSKVREDPAKDVFEEDVTSDESTSEEDKTAGIIEIDDSTDFEEEAKFNIQAFLAARGLLEEALPKERPELGQPPAFILENKLKDIYALPSTTEGFSQDGRITLEFTNKIKKQDIDELLEAFSPPHDSESERALRQLKDAQTTVSLKNDGDGSTVLQTGKPLVQIEQLFKLTQSVIFTLVPGEELYLDKKSFTWKLETYDSEKLGFKFEFKHPDYISVGKPDTMKIQISNAEKLFKPEDPGKLALPDGYIITQKIPPQGKGLLSVEEVKKVQESGQAFVFVNLIISILLQGILQLLLGSIIVVQILSHLPLADISLPAIAFQQFDLMITFVSFDLFSPTDYFNFGFAETPPWSERFDWVGYGSVNFFENMGSILIFGFQQILFLLLSFIVQPLKRRFCGSNFLDRFKSGSLAESAVIFIHGTFFEILLCVSLSLCKADYYPWLDRPDHISIIISGLFAFCLVAYLIFLVQFCLTKASKIAKMQQSIHEKNVIKFESEAHKELIDDQVKHKREAQAWELEARLAELSESRRKRTLQTETAKIANLEFYKVLFDGLKHNSTVALLNDVFIQVRRISLLFMAMFVVEKQWLQVIVFTQMNFIFLCYYMVVRPYDSARMNYVAVLNEVIILFLSYVIAQNQDMRYDPDYRNRIGSIILYSIYVLWACNVAIITFVSIKEVRANLRVFLEKRRIAKLNQTRAQERYITEAAQGQNDKDVDANNPGQPNPNQEVSKGENDSDESSQNEHEIEATVKADSKSAAAQNSIPAKTRAVISAKQDKEIESQLDEMFGKIAPTSITTHRRQSSGALFEPQSRLSATIKSSRLISTNPKSARGLGAQETASPLTRVTAAKLENLNKESSPSSDNGRGESETDQEFCARIEKMFFDIAKKPDEKRREDTKKQQPGARSVSPVKVMIDTTREGRRPNHHVVPAQFTQKRQHSLLDRMPNYAKLLNKRT